MLAAIKRQRPDDEAAWELAHQHFGCARETAASLHTRAQVCDSARMVHMQDTLAVCRQLDDFTRLESCRVVVGTAVVIGAVNVPNLPQCKVS